MANKTGIKTVKVLPRSTPGLCTSIRPPWASTSALLIARPSPLPGRRLYGRRFNKLVGLELCFKKPAIQGNLKRTDPALLYSPDYSLM